MKPIKKIFRLVVVVFISIFLAGKAKAQTLPEPDFTTIKEWYNIIKWTYDHSGQINIIVSPKNDGPQTHRFFIMRYFDEDGLDIVDTHYTQIIGLGYNTAPGQNEKVYAGAPEEYKLKKVTSVAIYRILEDGSIVPQAAPAKKNRTSSNTVPQPDKKELPKTNTTTTDNGNCSFEVQPQSKAGTPFSTGLMKSLIYERYSFQVNTGGLSSPSKIGVTYLNLQPGAAYTNGSGANRSQNGAPPNATIFPFTAKYIVCKQFSNATTRTQYECKFVAFKANNGNWDNAVDGVPKITFL
ncbi:MAG: hypothetical protein ABJA78_01985 [Ferruginibacter sp.]